MTPKRTTPPERERERRRDPDEVNGLPPIKSPLFATKTVMYSAKKDEERGRRKKEEFFSSSTMAIPQISPEL